jgi:hypothetical protein
MRDLNIDVICANTLAAKGRVERAHLTLQDRLVKEMRLAGVCSMEEGNLFLEGFRDRYNERFGRVARDAEDIHRPLLPEHKLDQIFQEHREAKVSRNLTLHSNRTMYVLDNCAANRGIAGKRVQILEDEDGQVTIRFQGRALRFRAQARGSWGYARRHRRQQVSRRSPHRDPRATTATRGATHRQASKPPRARHRSASLTHDPEPDISILHATGHLYFAPADAGAPAGPNGGNPHRVRVAAHRAHAARRDRR